jgi:hypothetical protein
MKTKAVLIGVCLFWVSTAIFAEDTPQPAQNGQMPRWFIGVEGAYAYNMMYSSTGYRPFSEYQGGHGFDVGIPVRFVIFDWLAVQSGVQFIQKSYSYIRTDDDRIYRTWTNSFLEFPLLGQVSVGLGSPSLQKRLRLFASAGVELGVWLNQHLKGSQPTDAVPGYGDTSRPIDIYYQEYEEDVPWNDKDNRFDAALLAGAGIQYNLDACTFFIEGRFYYGLTDLQKQYQRNQTPYINDTLVVSAGVLFNANIFKIFGGGK